MSSNPNDRPHRSLALRLCSSAIYDKTFCREITANYILHPVPTSKDSASLHQDFTRISLVRSDFTLDNLSTDLRLINPSQNIPLMQAIQGNICIGLATIPGLALVYLSFKNQPFVIECPLFIFAIELLLIGMQLFCFGLFAAFLLEQHRSLTQEDMAVDQTVGRDYKVKLNI